MIISAPLCVTHRRPVADATVLHRFGIGFSRHRTGSKKVTLYFSKIGEVAMNKKLLRAQMVSITRISRLRSVSTTCVSGWVRSAAERDMHIVRQHTLNRCQQVGVETKLNDRPRF